ncbi:MAG: polysaccharide deacetylase family protein [Armatimonadetes bacterium]|jgi:peptidoglycan/xylan/chitin deacetylase (PgdA/CDA1 family)|nr:polysaccharide deacetylase family protein [Armatimonadota bacterium]
MNRTEPPPVPACRRAQPLFLLCLLCLSLLLAAADRPVRADAYLGAVTKGAALLSQGYYPEAAKLFREARDLDMNDPLAVAGLGYALDASGQSAAARAELSLARKLNDRSRAASWASALAALNAGRLDEARAQIEALCGQGESPSVDLRIARAYVRCASGDAAGAAEEIAALGDRAALSAPRRSVAALIAGAAAFAEGKYPAAADLLHEAVRHLPPSTFFDRVLRHRAPILPTVHTARPMPMPLMSAPSLGENVRTRSGVVRLYLDAFRFADAEFAMFLVDGRCVHTTNARPFRYDWDTRRVRNGYHKVVIRAQDRSGRTLGETEEVLLIHNEGASFPPVYPEEEYRRADTTLAQAMILQPDVLASQYLLGLSLARSGNAEGAAAALEIVMGHDPDYAQARKELQALYATHNRGRLRVVSSVPTTARKIAITFDDGPHPLYTPPLLDLLERHHARCTMFLVGMQAETYPDIVREIVEKGHEIADHSYSHPNLETVDARTVEMELLRCRSVLRRITGKAVDLFRPPGGHADAKVGEICARYGFTTVYWDVFDSWLQKYDEATVLRQLVQSVKPGSIVLLHNGSNKTAGIVEPLLEELTRQGYQFVTVSELLSERTPGVEPPTEAPDAPEIRDDHSHASAAARSSR